MVLTNVDIQHSESYIPIGRFHHFSKPEDKTWLLIVMVWKLKLQTILSDPWQKTCFICQPMHMPVKNPSSMKHLIVSLTCTVGLLCSKKKNRSYGFCNAITTCISVINSVVVNKRNLPLRVFYSLKLLMFTISPVDDIGVFQVPLSSFSFCPLTDWMFSF